MGYGVTLFFDGATYFTEVLPERVIPIGGALLQIPRKPQLFAQGAPTFDRLRLMPFSFPDLVCDRKQFIGMFCQDKHTTIVIRKSHVTAFDDKISEACRIQR